MCEAQENGHQREWPEDRWCNDEIVLDMNSMPELPPVPQSEKYLAWARAERALMARWDAGFRAQLEQRASS